MPIQLSRLEDRRYIQLAILQGVVTVEEVEHWMEENIQIMDQHHLTLNGIVDVRGMIRMQASPFQIPSVLRCVRHPFTGWSVVIGASPLLQYWIERLERFFGVHNHAAESVEQGLRFLREQTWEPYMAGPAKVILYPAPRWLSQSIHFDALKDDACIVRVAGVATAYDLDIVISLLLEVIAHRETPLYAVLDLSQCTGITARPELMPRVSQILLDPLIREVLLVNVPAQVREFINGLGALTPRPALHEFRTMADAEFYVAHRKLTYSG